MTTDITLAFAHPEERAEALAGADPRDRISLRDHVVEVEIGAFQQERGTRQRIRFNVVVEVRPHPAPLEDDVDRILSYDRITEAIAAELASERLNLLETLAERVAERIWPNRRRCGFSCGLKSWIAARAPWGSKSGGRAPRCRWRTAPGRCCTRWWFLR